MCHHAPFFCSKLRLSRKCSKYVMGKKSAVGDKPAAKRHEKPISWDRLPFATAPLLTSEDINVQKTKVPSPVVFTSFAGWHCLAPQFLDIWNEDGLTAEPEDDLAWLATVLFFLFQFVHRSLCYHYIARCSLTCRRLPLLQTDCDLIFYHQSLGYSKLHLLICLVLHLHWGLIFIVYTLGLYDGAIYKQSWALGHVSDAISSIII